MGNDVRVVNLSFSWPDGSIKDADGWQSTCFTSADDMTAEISAEVKRRKEIMQLLIWSKYKLMAGINKSHKGFFRACQWFDFIFIIDTGLASHWYPLMGIAYVGRFQHRKVIVPKTRPLCFDRNQTKLQNALIWVIRKYQTHMVQIEDRSLCVWLSNSFLSLTGRNWYWCEPPGR